MNETLMIFGLTLVVMNCILAVAFYYLGHVPVIQLAMVGIGFALLLAAIVVQP